MVDNLMSDLGHGVLKISAREYNGAIIELFENAQRTVFCVQNGKTLNFWSRFLSDDILTSHSKSNATVVRIFVFDVFDDVNLYRPVKALAECGSIVPSGSRQTRW